MRSYKPFTTVKKQNSPLLFEYCVYIKWCWEQVGKRAKRHNMSPQWTFLKTPKIGSDINSYYNIKMKCQPRKVLQGPKRVSKLGSHTWTILMGRSTNGILHIKAEATEGLRLKLCVQAARLENGNQRINNVSWTAIASSVKIHYLLGLTQLAI